METESFAHWETLWKTIFLATIVVFAGMSIWVTIGGFQDIKKLFARLKEDETPDSQGTSAD